jgi:hypothetical protein
MMLLLFVESFEINSQPRGHIRGDEQRGLAYVTNASQGVTVGRTRVTNGDGGRIVTKM